MRVYTAAEVLFGLHYAEAVTVDDQRWPVADLSRLSVIECAWTDTLVKSEAGGGAATFSNKANCLSGPISHRYHQWQGIPDPIMRIGIAKFPI